MYKNKILDFSDKYPVLAFFIVPIGIGFGGTFLSATIRKYKTGSVFRGIAAGEDETPNLLSGRRTEGGDELDMIFRAHAPTGPASEGVSDYEMIQRQPGPAPVRYDEDYHDVGFFSDATYSPNQGTITQPTAANVKQSFVFAGLNGINKIRKW